ncbi:hypothetical protein [Catellatospora vulcania]|uniref:hypothetical protein n=1 Tax=Catellatospora vulcania TaxID=1460450 RepID=UPI0018B00F99|nr:hypothetical protein [Catellatospora vulcania]
MNAPAGSALSLIDGVDVDAVAGAARACRGVEDLESGFPEVATYLPGRRVRGVRIVGDAVEVHIRVAWGVPAYEIAAAVQAAVVPLIGRHEVNVMIASLGDPPLTAEPVTAESDRTGTIGLIGRAPLAHASQRAGKVQGDPLLGEIQATPTAIATRPGPLSAALPGPDPAGPDGT